MFWALAAMSDIRMADGIPPILGAALTECHGCWRLSWKIGYGLAVPVGGRP
jgi:hypothetical protein